MIKYEVQEQDDGIVISANQNNQNWLVNVVFDKSEKVYADAFCKILNDETKRAYDGGKFEIQSLVYNTTGKFF